MGIKNMLSNLLELFFQRVMAPLYFCAIFALPLATYTIEKVARGTNWIIISLAILIGAIYFQFREINNFFKEGKIVKSFVSGSKTIRYYFYFMSTAGLVVFISLLINYYNTFNSPDAGNITLSNHPKLAILYYTFWSLLFGVMTSAVIYMLLFLGPLSNGVSLALAFHNWANGMGIDYKILFETALNISLPDALALFINIIWFIISVFISNLLKIET